MKNLKKKVLIIDDDDEVPMLFSSLIEANHCECFSASNPADALNHIQEIKPDLLLLDLNLPQMSGYGLLREIKHNPETAHIPVIILSSLKDSEIVRGAMELGAVGYLTKDCSTEEFTIMLDAYTHYTTTDSFNSTCH